MDDFGKRKNKNNIAEFSKECYDSNKLSGDAEVLGGLQNGYGGVLSEVKKKALLVIAALSMLLLPGCLASTYALTDEEMDIIAEYAAGVLLRNDEYYEEALVTPTPSPSPEPALSPTPNPSATPTPTKKPNQDDATGNQKPPAQEELPVANANLTEVYGLAGLEVKYKSASIIDSHSEGSYRITPTSGKQLVRVYFTVSNVSGITQTINFGSLDIDYRLSCGEKNFVPPTISVIDLLYLELELPAGESRDCVLFFNIDKSSTLENADLVVSRGEEVSIISLNK